MKKFLTVLLVIAVMFTFSFGSAFAAAATAPQAKLLAEAKAYAEGIVAANYETAYKAVVKETLQYAPTSITQKAAWDAVDVKAALQNLIDTKYAEAAATYDAYVSETDAKVLAGKLFATTNGFISETNGTAAVASEELTNVIFDLCEEAVTLYAFAADREAVLAGFDKVDYSVYSSTEKEAVSGKTYLTLAEEKVAAGKVAAGDDAWVFEPETFPDANLVHLTAAMGTLKAEVAKYITEKTIDVNGTPVGLGIFYVKDIKTISGLEGDKLVDEATVATYKARIAAVVAEYMKNTTSPSKTLVADFQEVFNYLAEEANTDAEFNAALSGLEVIGLAGLSTADKTVMANAVDAVEEMDAYAAKYAAERNAEGALVRDAEEVADLADEYQEAAYLAVCDQIMTGTYVMPNARTYEAAIEAATIAAAEEGLAFAKEVAKEDLADALDSVIDDYYALEAAKIQAKYEKQLAAIEAATTVAKVKLVNVTAANLISGLNDADTVDGLVSYSTGTPAAKALDAVNTYVNYANYGKNVLNDEYIVGTEAAIKDAINTIYGEAGARKVSELKAVAIDPATVAAGLPTVGGLKAAKADADAACAALPTKATLADKAAIEEAFKLVEAYKDMCEDATTYVALSNEGSLTTAITQLFADMQYDFAKKIAAVDKTDKAALRALQAELDAANDLIDTDELFEGKAPEFDANEVVAKAIEKIRDAELVAVIKAINAIPVNVTEADKAVVEAARTAYDAFVADWTDYADYDDYYAAGEIENFRELALAEAALGLNAEDPAYSVESLKIKARTDKAKKGSITVRWTVVDGDDSAVEGYEIWKSTKHSSGYKKMVTKSADSDWYKNTKGLKKGTRYYYKVRAIAYTEDGVKVKSDFSNKARRIAK